jgi:penicillin-insensitive murein DD-endopeptidase
MRRIRFESTAVLIVAAFAASAPAEAVEANMKVPVPTEVSRSGVPMPVPKSTISASELKKAAQRSKNKKNKKEPIAKKLFGAKKTAAALAPRAIGWYAKGCLAGGKHLSDAGDFWQTMRPSRNRAWGHPKMIRLLKRLGREAKESDGWPGLLVGDISQPRGGPMLTGHMSHQVGLDADVWLSPMPDRVLTRREREDTSAKSMLDKTKLAVDPKVFTDKHVALIKRAASYGEVQRIFVHPAIKKALCEKAGTDRGWLGKVRPLWGHHYHFHIRMHCTNSGCRKQNPVTGDDGCGKEVTNWLKKIAKSLEPQPPPKPGAKKWIPPSARRKLTIEQLPDACRTVLESPGATLVEEDLPEPKPSQATAARK